MRKLFRIATDQFRDEEAARRWLQHPLRALSGKTPLEMCATELGAEEAEAILGRIAHGIVC
ncbi:MAG TPA: MbcA/ParS/Xre antitoxin family protein [Opitutaceae bacterium]|nr:MbcA/ParS/Xre antitoxin family protein [Opitutaceae bacterium]